MTYGDVSFRDIVMIVHNKTKVQAGDYFVVIGTDSHNTSKTKIVAVVAIYCVGRGGFFFYDTHTRALIPTIREKLLQETQLSLELADSLIKEFEEYYDETGFDYTDLNFAIHVDAGQNGKSSEMITEVIGWIRACGYDCQVKPNAFVASNVADKYSK